MPRPDKENTHAPRPSSSRHRKVSARAQHTLGAKATAAQILLTKKRQKAKRKALRHRQNEDALTLELPGDTDVVRQLRAALARTRGERNAAEASASRPARPKGPAVGSIPKPSNMTKVTVDFIRRKLKLSGDKNDEKWNDLRAEVRRFLDAGLLDMSIGWKAQDDRRLIKIRDAIEAAHPELLCFRNQWGTEYLIHETFSGQKTYKKCKGKAGTYRARAREARRSKRGTDNSDDDEEDSGCSGRGPLAPAESPTLSPPPSPRRSPPPRAQSLPELTPEPEEDR
ncbi:hypothetical protein FB45DRAFT_1006209 [Roridomyces roridus]|uniref:Uncharacterized protein n=1 Tax=Roridomyces roridus TaxID=1738132 RepID=A0AAD7BIR6_9AGAR|nr:hypothetical protein FB45DRAFT_1006209 [Roridomyces roridus]